MGAFARLLSLASPRRAVKRAAMARALALVQRPVAQYDGAGRGHRMGWRVFSRRSPAEEVANAVDRLRAVSRDMARNNAYAARAFSAIVSNAVGEGIIPAIKCDKPRTKSKVQLAVKQHLDTKAIDFDGRNTLYGLQALAMRTVAEAGECLIIRRFPKASQRLSVPLQIQLLEPDFLDSSKDGPQPGGGAIISGIEFDAGGVRVAYHLHRAHPGSGLGAVESVRVPAAQVIHLYRVDRPGQVRGVPWLAPAMITLWDLARYEEAELVRQEIAACFAAFVTEPDGELALEAGKNATPADNPALAPRETLEAGTIQYLRNGSTVSFGNPPQVQSYEAFIRAQLRKIAVAIGLPFEVLAGDLSQVNFSSGRMGWLEFQRVLGQWRWHLMISHFCDGVGAWFAEALAVKEPTATGWSMEWTPPRREMIQPKEEVEADIQEIRAGLSTRSEKLRSRGYDPEDVEREAALENERTDKLKLSFDSDGRRPRQGDFSKDKTPAPDAGANERAA